ncbi:MAG: hypothetical protein PHC99_00740 [Methylococcales bacterium]|nr:hypothetical protein [Methylococcales bacterium]
MSNPKKINKPLTMLFITWFLYSAGMLFYMALNDITPSHCLSLKNTENVYEN